MVPTRPGLYSTCSLDSGSLLSPSVATIFTLGRAAMPYPYYPESEPQTNLNSTSDSSRADDPVEFDSLSHKNLIRLGEDLLHVFSSLRQDGWEFSTQTSEFMSSISDLMQKGGASTGLSSADATALAEMFHEVTYPHQPPPSSP